MKFDGDVASKFLIKVFRCEQMMRMFAGQELHKNKNVTGHLCIILQMCLYIHAINIPKNVRTSFANNHYYLQLLQVVDQRQDATCITAAITTSHLFKKGEGTMYFLPKITK